MAVTLIADSGATKCEWCLLEDDQRKTIVTTGINPYFLTGSQIQNLLQKELLPALNETFPEQIFFYGSGLGNKDHVKVIHAVLKKLFPQSYTSDRYRHTGRCTGCLRK